MSSQYKITRQEKAVLHDQESIDITSNKIKPPRITGSRIIGYLL